MDKDLVIGLDRSTPATKAIAWTRDGSFIAEGRSPIPLASPAANWYEQNPEDCWGSACVALRGLLELVTPGRIAASGISTQRETFVPMRRMAVPCGRLSSGLPESRFRNLSPLEAEQRAICGARLWLTAAANQSNALAQ